MPMFQDSSDHIRSAVGVLLGNRREGFTIPTARLYPFQWNWDSAFISIGYARFDVELALSELETLVSGQWENGMIPHIIFHTEDETTYFPNWDYWDSEVNTGAPSSPKTSGITQPPVIAIALLHIFRLHKSNEDILKRLQVLWQKAYAFQEFWYKFRDVSDDGLVSIIHPWESGRDNSPVWDGALDAIDLDSEDIPEYSRRDVTITDASERPTDRQYDQYVFLMKLAHKYAYDGREIFEESKFVMQDCMVNALLIKSNAALIELGEAFGFPVSELKEWNAQSIDSFNNKLWSEELSVYCTYDLINDRLVKLKEVGGFSAIYSGCCPDDRIVRMAGQLKRLRDNGYLLVPSYDPHTSGFDPRRYWRGPIWPQMNWLIYMGLMENGYEILAASVRKDLMDLVKASGFREYFDPRRDELRPGKGGYGGDRFSWTASTYIDLIHHR